MTSPPRLVVYVSSCTVYVRNDGISLNKKARRRSAIHGSPGSPAQAARGGSRQEAIARAQRGKAIARLPASPRARRSAQSTSRFYKKFQKNFARAERRDRRILVCVPVRISSLDHCARARARECVNYMDLAEAKSMIDQNNAWSAQQAQKQMDFQERMSNTAHQREVEDLKAAGLNPVLSAKLGGASTPSGAMGDTDTSGTSTLIQLAMSAVNAAGGAARAAANATDKNDPKNFSIDGNITQAELATMRAAINQSQLPGPLKSLLNLGIGYVANRYNESGINPQESLRQLNMGSVTTARQGDQKNEEQKKDYDWSAPFYWKPKGMSWSDYVANWRTHGSALQQWLYDRAEANVIAQQKKYANSGLKIYAGPDYWKDNDAYYGGRDVHVIGRYDQYGNRIDGNWRRKRR